MNTEYYVYLHRRKTDDKVFYVGKGKGKRAYSVHGRNSRWNNTYKKHGLVVEIVFDNLTEQDAFNLEIDTILEMRYHYSETICNLTDGGEGVSGYKWEDVSKHPCVLNRGRKTSPEVIEKIAAALRGKKRHPNVVRKVAMAVRKSKSGSMAFTQMARFLRGYCPFPAIYLAKLSFDPSTFYVKRDYTHNRVSREGIEKSANMRRGKPSWNSSQTIYEFLHKGGEVLIGTKRDLAIKIGGNLQHTLKNISKVIKHPDRNTAYGWAVIKESNDRTNN